MASLHSRTFVFEINFDAGGHISVFFTNSKHTYDVKYNRPTKHDIKFCDSKQGILTVPSDLLQDSDDTAVLTCNGRLFGTAELTKDILAMAHVTISVNRSLSGNILNDCVLYRNPILTPPEKRILIERTVQVLGKLGSQLCCDEMRSMAWQCLAICLKDHFDFIAPCHVLNVLRDFSLGIPSLSCQRSQETAQILFGAQAFARHRPRCGYIQIDSHNNKREVVLFIGTHGALEVIDTNILPLIVPDELTWKSVSSLNPDLTIYTYKRAREIYSFVWSYGTFEYAPNSVMVYTSCKNILQECKITRVCSLRLKWWARFLDACDIDIPRFSLVSLRPQTRNILWVLFLLDMPGPIPIPRVQNRLLSNLNTSIAHKTLDILHGFPRRKHEDTRDMCIALREMVTLGTAGQVRDVFDEKLTNVIECDWARDVGLVFQSIVFVMLFIQNYLL